MERSQTRQESGQPKFENEQEQKIVTLITAIRSLVSENLSA